MKRIPLSDLIFDDSLYPRDSIDDEHVFGLVEAIRANATLPPFVICRKSKRVVDGFHRGKAYRRVYGSDFEVDVVEKEYKSDADFFLDAIKYNVSHGRSMTTADRQRSAAMAERLGIDDDRLSAVLCVSHAMIGGLRATGNDGATLSPSHDKRKKFIARSPHTSKRKREMSKDRRVVLSVANPTENNHDIFDRVIDVVVSGIDYRDTVLIKKVRRLKAILIKLEL